MRKSIETAITQFTAIRGRIAVCRNTALALIQKGRCGAVMILHDILCHPGL